MAAVSIIAPTFNEEQTIGRLVEALKKLDLDKEIIVIDDGSTDRTPEILAGIDGVRVVTHPYNKGNGAAVKTGIREAKNDWLVIIDGDGQHDPADIPRLVAQLDRYDLVVGARAPETEAGRLRKAGNRLLAKLGSLLTGFPIEDMTCGLRAFKRRSALKFLSLYPDGFSFPTTSTMCFLVTGLNVTYVPIRAARRVAGSKSKINFWRDGIRFAVMIFRVVMFNPLKVFLPLGAFFLLAGLAWSVKTIYFQASISAGGLLLMLFGFNFVFFGFVLDQVVGLRKDLIHRDDLD